VQDFAGKAVRRQFGRALLSARPREGGTSLIRVAALMAGMLLIALVIVASIQRPKRVTSVVLVVLDTVRADHLTPYGYPKETTPRLARFAQEGLLFEQARSAAPWTLPSHASLFTGKLPSQHGCNWEHRWLADSQETIAEVLGSPRAGFETLGVTTNVNASSLYNLHQGFSRFVETWTLRESHRGLDDSAIANGVIREWLGKRDASRPFFLFVNYADAHLPYVPPPPDDRMFGEASERARRLAGRGDLLQAVLSGEERPTAEDFAGLAALYDGELRKVDGLLGDLLDELDRHGLRDDTLVIVTSDHGELLGEEGGVDHQLSLREELLHVPLLLRWPRMVKPARVPEPVSLTMVKSWLDEIAQGVAQNGEFHLPAWSPSPDRAPKVIDSEYFRPVDLVDFVRAHGGDADAIDLRRAAAWRREGAGALKLVVREGRDARLYRIGVNGREEPWNDAPEALVDEMREALENQRALGRFRESPGDLAPAPAPDGKSLEDLRRLGYVGAAARPGLSIHALEHWAAGERALARKDATDAALELARAADLAPGEPDLLYTFARVLDGLTDPSTAAALESYLRAIAGSPAAKSERAEWARARLGALGGPSGR
jgi:choline-sulfatase